MLSIVQNSPEMDSKKKHKKKTLNNQENLTKLVKWKRHISGKIWVGKGWKEGELVKLLSYEKNLHLSFYNGQRPVFFPYSSWHWQVFIPIWEGSQLD